MLEIDFCEESFEVEVQGGTFIFTYDSRLFLRVAYERTITQQLDILKQYFKGSKNVTIKGGEKFNRNHLNKISPVILGKIWVAFTEKVREISDQYLDEGDKEPKNESESS